MSLKFAPDKLALMLALVPYLDEVRVVSVAEAAEHFAVAPAEIDAAVRLIAMTGVAEYGQIPQDNEMFGIDWDALDDDGVIVLTNSVVIEQTPRFSRAEASALIAALQYLAALPGSADNDTLNTLMRKLAAAGNAAVPAIAVALPTDPVREQLMHARESGAQVQFDYANPNGSVEARTVHPLQLSSDNGIWYLGAWDYGREAQRTFRLDRMSNLQTTDQLASVPRSLTVSDTLFTPGDNDFDVTLEVARAGISLLGDFVSGVQIPAGDPVIIDVRVAHLHLLKRIVVAHPELIRVTAPESAVETVRAWAHAGIDAANSQPARG